MSSRLTTEEMAYIIEDCGAQAFVTSAYKADQAAELADQMPQVKVRLMLDGVDRRATSPTRRPSPPSRPRRSTRSASRARTCSTARAPPAGPRA